MKIVYIMDRHTGPGGIERVISLKANYLISKGYQVHIVACYDPNEKLTPFFYFDPRIKFTPIKRNSIHKKYKKEVIEDISKILHSIKPDITITIGEGALRYVGQINDGSKKIVEYHYSRYKRKYKWAILENSKIGRGILKLLFYKDSKIISRYDQIVVLTEEDKTSRLVYPFKQITVIPNPISFRAETPASLTKKQIIAIGRIEYQKGFDRLVKIWSKIEKEYPDWEITIFGDGRKKAKLEKLIAKLSLQKRIKITPPVEDIQNRIADSSIFVSTSRYEGLPMVLLETFACGVPAVAFAFKCGVRESIDDGINGYYAEMNDEKKFISNLKTLMDNRDIRVKLGLAAYEKSKLYEIDNIMSKWISLFDELLKT